MNLSNYNWQEILEKINKETDENSFYMLTFDKGTKQENRTRFMTLSEIKDLISKIADGTHADINKYIKT